jgi:predicted dehydrogenase
VSWRVGIVGAGFGTRIHLPAFRAQGQFEVVALASPSSAAHHAAERKVPQAFASIEAMLDGVEVDVVSVASPPFHHRDAVLLALARGKHVLCEKPFAMNVAQAEEMLEAARRAGTVCAVAHEFRYTPSRQAIRELIVNDHLGPLRDIEYTLLTHTLRSSTERAESWWFRRDRGGGIAGAWVSHLVDTASWLVGRAPRNAVGVMRLANVQRTHQGRPFRSEVDDGAFALIDYGEGIVGRITADATVAVGSATLAVHGELRTAVASGPSILESTLFSVDAEETAELELRASAHAALESVDPSLPPFVTLLDEFVKALEGQPAALPTFADAVATQRVLAAIGYGAQLTPGTAK